MISLYAFLSTLALILPTIKIKILTFCDENNISYDITVQLGRTVSRTNSQTVNIDVNTKIEPIKIKFYKEEQSKYPIGGKLRF